MRLSKGLVLVNVLIFVFLFSILASILLELLSSTARLAQRHIVQAKAYYVAEAGSVHVLDALRRNAALPPPQQIDWTHNMAGGWTSLATYTYGGLPGGGIWGTDLLNVTCTYSTAW